MQGNPSKDLPVALVADPGDAAFDTAHPDFARAVAAYERSRTVADLAAVPLRAGHVGLTLYVLAPLTAGQLTTVRAQGDASYREASALLGAIRAVVTDARVEADGTVHGTRVPVTRLQDKHGRDIPEAAAYPFIEQLQEEEGGQAIQELGAFVIERATVSPRKLAPFALPYPLKAPA